MRGRTTTTRVAAQLAFISMFGALPTASAVAEEARAGGMLEEVIVTARKVEESAQDVPIAITALSRNLPIPASVT